MNAANKLRRIRWNNDDRGVVHPAHAEVWYDAARKWNEIIRRESSEFWFKLTPGTIVSKYYRMMFSLRTGTNPIVQFSTTGESCMDEVRLRVTAAYAERTVSCSHKPKETTGLLLCIVPRDDFMSRYRETNFDHERVIRHNLNQVASVNNAAHGVNDKKKPRYVPHPKSSKKAKPQDNSHPGSSEKPDLETTAAATTTTVTVDTLNKPDLDKTATVKRPRSLSERQRRRRRIVNTIF